METVIDGFWVKSRERVGKTSRTIKTQVFVMESGMFHAFSHYAMDKEEEIPGVGESTDKDEAIKLSKKHLKQEWAKAHPSV